VSHTEAEMIDRGRELVDRTDAIARYDRLRG
jgi:hypothetical protein